LFTDAQPLARFRAAQGVLAAGDRSGLPVLIALLETGPVELAQQAEEFLKDLSADKAPALALTEETGQRKKCREAWEAWLDKHGAQASLAKCDFGVSLDGAGSGAGAVARRFVDALLKSDIDALVKTIDVPFRIEDILSLDTVDKFRELFGPVLKQEK